jgi:hypothetical protein
VSVAASASVETCPKCNCTSTKATPSTAAPPLQLLDPTKVSPDQFTWSILVDERAGRKEYAVLPQGGRVPLALPDWVCTQEPVEATTTEFPAKLKAPTLYNQKLTVRCVHDTGAESIMIHDCSSVDAISTSQGALRSATSATGARLVTTCYAPTHRRRSSR